MPNGMHDISDDIHDENCDGFYWFYDEIPYHMCDILWWKYWRQFWRTC